MFHKWLQVHLQKVAVHAGGVIILNIQPIYKCLEKSQNSTEVLKAKKKKDEKKEEKKDESKKNLTTKRYLLF